VKWAGRPADVAAKETQDVLTRRNSFDTWVQEHNDQSAPWKRDELQCAREIFSEFLDIVTAQLLLKQENVELREFAARAAHDLKAPLRGIKHALDWMSEDDLEPDSVREKHAIAKRSSARVTALADSILELAVVESLPLKVKPVKLDQVVGDVKDLLFMQLQEHGATITHTPLPILNCDQSTVLRIFMNLTLNALTFRKPDVPPVIHVNSTVLGNGETQLSFSDNGIGIAQKFADRVFRPLVRLHSKDQIEGTGLGLAICDRIMDRHGGIIRLDTTYSEGARFQIIFPKTAKVVT
jgi:chemotaxis family two-component system sensor kinase Cph1